MCGIVGYIGDKQAGPILLKGLIQLEYRGYDSAGLAVRNDNNEVSVVKAKGRLQALADKTDNGNALSGCSGIGHTRWATHGEPTENNAHPHVSDDHNVTAVHNGIIENYAELREKLIEKGYEFYSETDTEVAVKTIDYYYKKGLHDPCEAISKTMERVRGSYALAVMFKDHPDEIWVARKDNPMVIGMDGDDVYMASDVAAILKYTRDVYYIDNMELAKLTRGGITFYNTDCEVVQKETVHVNWDAEAAEKGGYEHFMIKEIHEQPRAVTDTLNSVINDGRLDFSRVGLPDELFTDPEEIYFIACGSAYHVGVAAQYVFEDLAQIPVRVELASEFRYRNLPLCKSGLAVIISQSGETADSLAALRKAKENGLKTLAIVNVLGSTIAREADYVFYTVAGPEIAVATTKAYSAQLVSCYMLAVRMAEARGMIDDARCSELIDAMQALPEKMNRLLEGKERMQRFASKVCSSKDSFFIGRGIDYAISLEGSLKMKEISYIHSEAYAAGELKHGTISLIEDGMLVIGVATQDRLYEKTISNMIEVKTRGAYIAGVANEGQNAIEEIADFTIYIPRTEEHFTASLAVIPLQLLSYYVSVELGQNVDKPRNLAKSVTVE